MGMLAAGPARAAFTNVVRLVLCQGEIPTRDGAVIPGAGVYTGAVDTFVWRETPVTAYGDVDTLQFGGSQWVGFSSNASRAYIRFDLSNALPRNAVVVSAALQLRNAGMQITGYGSRLAVRTADWTTNITWNTAGGPASGGQRIGDVFWHAWRLWASNEVQTVDVSPIVQAWHSGSLSNYGLQFDCNEDGTLYQAYRFYSSDHAAATNRPQLVIDYLDVGAVARPESFGGAYARVEALVTNGPAVFEDTYIAHGPGVEGSNYAAAAYCDTRTYNNAGTPRRILVKLRTDLPALAGLARSTDPIVSGVPRLVNARVEFSTIRFIDWFTLWPCTQSWDVATVTELTRDGVNPWAQGWTNNAISNVGASLGDRVLSPVFKGASFGWDVTDIVQGYVDGVVSNHGFVLGQSGSAAYDNWLALTEYSVSVMRPTLVLQTYIPFRVGTIFSVE